MIKRAFDIVVSFILLVFLSPLGLLAALLVKWDSPGTVFFKQARVGKDFQTFSIYKFRTMVQDAAAEGSHITFGADPRITRVGHFLRRTKIDEFPQLINVFRGEMSFVGPRPEVREYTERFRQDFEEILTIKPGITDMASLKYHDEARYLGTFQNPELEYATRVLPQKIVLAKEYKRNASFLLDLQLILKTIVRVFSP